MEALYGIGYFLEGNHHVLCRESAGYRFHILTPHSDLMPARLDYDEARTYIETHPVCTNISHHEIRIMTWHEIQDILLGRTPASTVSSVILDSEEEEEEEPLH